MNQTEIQIIKLKQLSIGAMQPLLVESKAQGFELVERLVAEYADGNNTFQQSGEGLFGVYVDRQLIAIGGLNRDPYLEGGDTGRLRHVYVLAAWRRRSIGKLLVQHIIAEARLHFRRLTLRTFDASADAFYRALGFQARTDIPNASHCMDFTQ
jgi:GNAT superfamily N-acetyltransferase